MPSQFKQVMLAKTWTEDVDPTGWLMSEKHDGCRAEWTGSQIYSRQGNVFDKIPTWFKAQLPPNIMLDGELTIGRNQFQKSLDIVKQQRSASINDFSLITYRLFDAPLLKGDFQTRISELNQIVETLKCPFLKVEEQIICTGPAHMKQLLQSILSQGGEGLILRKGDSTYEFGKRSNAMLKVKQFDSAEARVVAHLGGKGRLSGMCGKLSCVLPSGITFKCGSGMDDKLRAHPPNIGSIIEFKSHGTTHKGTPRCPVYLRQRGDLTWSDVVNNYQLTIANIQPSTLNATPTPCVYGTSCYRKNVQHIADFSHD